MPYDLGLLYFLNSLAGRSLALDALIIFLSTYLTYLLVILWLAFLIFSTHELSKKLQIFLTGLLSVFIARGIVTPLIRFLWHRARPLVLDQTIYPLLYSASGSFPSGHTAFLFALGSVLWLYNKSLGILFLAASLLVAISRIAAGLHWPSDILGGMIIGIGSTALALRYKLVRIARFGRHNK